MPSVPCRVVCVRAGIGGAPANMGLFRYVVFTITYTCTDCRGKTWQETKHARSLRVRRTGTV